MPNVGMVDHEDLGDEAFSVVRGTTTTKVSVNQVV